MILNPNALARDALGSHPQLTTGGRAGGEAKLEAHPASRNAGSLTRQTWQREMERAQILAWSVKAVEGALCSERGCPPRQDAAALGAMSLRSPQTGLSSSFFLASQVSTPIGSVDSKPPTQAVVPAKSLQQSQAQMSAAIHSRVEAQSYPSRYPPPGHDGAPTSDWQGLLPERTASGSASVSDSLVLARQRRADEPPGLQHVGGPFLDSFDATLEGRVTRSGFSHELQAVSGRESRNQPPTVQRPSPELLGLQAFSAMTSSTSERLTEGQVSTKVMLSSAAGQATASAPQDKSPSLKPHGPAAMNWRLSLTPSLSKISVHAERSPVGLNIWIGLPMPEVPREEALVWMVQTLFRQLASQGLRLNRLVCNGRLMRVEDTPAQATLPFIDFSGLVRCLAPARGADALHT